MARHSGERPYPCKYCPKTFKYNNDFYTHRIIAHPEEYAKERGRANVLLQRSNGTSQNKDAVSKKPNKVAMAKIKKPRYWKQSGTALIPCEECGLEIRAKSLANHIRCKHNKEPYAHVCSVCNKSYPFQYLLQVRSRLLFRNFLFNYRFYHIEMLSGFTATGSHGHTHKRGTAQMQLLLGNIL